MTLDDLIEKLQELRKTEGGNVQVTCTHSLISSPSPGDIFETTIENLEVHNHPTIGRAIRVWL